MRCPICHGDEGFEKRGDVRRYIKLDQELSEGTWHDENDVAIDVGDDGKEVIYCLECDSEFSEDELRLLAAVDAGEAEGD